MRKTIIASLLLLTSCATIKDECTVLNGCKFESGNTLVVYPSCDFTGVIITNFTDVSPELIFENCQIIKFKYKFNYGYQHSLVVRLVWDQKVAGSNPAYPTIQ